MARILTSLILVAALVSPAAAQGETKEIGLVLLYSDGTVHSEIVTVPADATTFDVLDAADIEMVSTETSFGPAVCKIGNDGCPADDCFCSSSSWAYFHLQDGEWVSSDVGAGTFVPEDGAVEGFAFTAYDANFAPVTKPPVATFADIEAGTVVTMVAVTPAATVIATPTPAAPAQLPVTGGEQGTVDWVNLLAAAGATLLVAGLWLRRRQAA